MADSIISVEKLGKMYQISHQAERRGSKTFRETATQRALHLFGGVSRNGGGGKSASDRSVSSREEFWALRDVSFEVQQGEVLGIIGRNGAGKSTLLKVLSRITEPTEGRVRIAGRVASLLEVGTGFHPELTGRENIFLNGAILGMSKVEIKRKFDEIVSFAGTEKFLDTPVKRYSSGMYVRLAFAVAAHLEPEVLIVDEVLSVGDAEFQKKCLGKMHDVTRQGRTVLFVSHNIAAIKSLCTSGIFLQNGKVFRRGDIDSVMFAYLAGTESRDAYNLRDRTDREGLGHVRMTRIWMEDSSNRVVDHASSGDELNIAIEYESILVKPLKNVRLSVSVQNIYDQPLFLCSTELISSKSPDCVPSGIIRCVIPRFPLSGGSYRVNIFFEVDGIVQDWLSNAASIAVEDGDFYKSGKLYPLGWQGKGVLVDHRWEWPHAIADQLASK